MGVGMAKIETYGSGEDSIPMLIDRLAHIQAQTRQLIWMAGLSLTLQIIILMLLLRG